MPSRYSIKDLERISGIKAHTLRIWEQRYNILTPERTQTNIRYYNNYNLKKIINVALLNNNGFKISAIAKMSDSELLKEVERFLNDYKKESDQVDHLVLCLMDLDESKFEQIMNNAIIHFGFEDTMEKIIFPFFRQMGNLWLLGIINPAQEHYISNLIRQKIIVGIDRITTRPGIQARKILLYLPQLELHEMGLLYAHYLSKLRGHQCFYLGQSVPLEDLTAICKQLKPDQILSIYTAPNAEIDLNEYLHACAQQIPDIPFLISGRMVVGGEYALKIPSTQFTVFEDFTALKRLL
ncbi:MAG: MerR family transcriptional regulator [Sphingobacteriia bacterium]|nr:MerR family transcriptional regulator [Bacteroidia bacterium]NBY10851.1 MerR family transcriptional regulator [Sphingobacteriia bacterium]